MAQDVIDTLPVEVVAELKDEHLCFERGDQAELADALLDRLAHERSHVVHDEGEIWTYEPARGIWQRAEREAMLRIVKGFAGAPVGRNGELRVSISTAEGAVKFAGVEVHREGFFAAAAPGVAFADGFVTVKNGKIDRLPHSPNNCARHGFGFAYRVVPHPGLDAFFEDVFAKASEEDRAARIAMIQEFIGACIIGQAVVYQRCLSLYGTGGNGKGQLLNIARCLFPPGAVVSVPPQEWDQRFQLSRLVGALANLCDEMPDKEIVGGDRFKSVITGDPIHTERKHQDAFEFRPCAGHVFSANALPGTVDHSHGFWRRMMVCLFERDMEQAPTHRVNAAHDVITRELPALAAWAIDGAARLQRQGHYTEPESSRAAVADWRKNSDNVALFVEERTEPDMVGSGIRASVIYGAYRAWALDNGYRALSSKSFGQRMAALGKGSTHRSDGSYYPVQIPLRAA